MENDFHSNDSLNDNLESWFWKISWRCSYTTFANNKLWISSETLVHILVEFSRVFTISMSNFLKHHLLFYLCIYDNWCKTYEILWTARWGNELQRQVILLYQQYALIFFCLVFSYHLHCPKMRSHDVSQVSKSEELGV